MWGAWKNVVEQGENGRISTKYFIKFLDDIIEINYEKIKSIEKCFKFVKNSSSNFSTNFQQTQLWKSVNSFTETQLEMADQKQKQK